MKKLILLIYIFTLNFPLFAQQGHMSFLGIPVDGKIEVFNQKIVAKGFKPDVSHNAQKASPYWYTGYFAGYSCDVYVHFSKHSRTVYDVSIAIDDYNSALNRTKLNNFVKAVKMKYKGKYFLDADVDEDDYTFSMKRYIKDERYDEDRVLGEIRLYLSDGSGYTDKNNSLWIIFEDNINYKKYKKEDDLDL
jgi:hypothetical protein